MQLHIKHCAKAKSLTVVFLEFRIQLEQKDVCVRVSTHTHTQHTQLFKAMHWDCTESTRKTVRAGEKGRLGHWVSTFERTSDWNDHVSKLGKSWGTFWEWEVRHLQLQGYLPPVSHKSFNAKLYHILVYDLRLQSSLLHRKKVH